ncbi:hypothetical protein ACIQF6_16675 [Kitasatospora sp. NPDC092948]
MAAVVLGGTALIGAPSASARVCTYASCSSAIDNWNGTRIQ